MNTQNLSTKRPASMFTMLAEFSNLTLFHGFHKQFTFRGDDLTPLVNSQVYFLKMKRQELLETHKLYKVTIYDNRAGSKLPFCVVLQWYHSQLIHDNTNLLLEDLKRPVITSNSFVQRMLNENFITVSHE